MPILNIPYFSQEAPDANLFANDCGVVCAKMLLDWAHEGIFICNKLSEETALALKDIGLTPEQVQTLIASHGLEMEVRPYTTLDSIKKSIDTGNPVIVLGLGKAIGNINAKGGHFIIVTGYDDSKFYINDPYWWGTNIEKGHNLPVDPTQLYNFMEDEEYKRECLFVVKAYSEPQPCVLKQVNSPKGLNFRAEPDGTIFLLLKDKSTICLMPDNPEYDGIHTWQHIYMGGYFGWVDQEYLIDIPNTPAPPILPVETRKIPVGPAFTNTPNDVLHLRLDHSSISKILASIPNNSNLKVLSDDEILGTDKFVWDKVTWNGLTGWVANQYLVPGVYSGTITTTTTTGSISNASWQSYVGPHYMGNPDISKVSKVYGIQKAVETLNSPNAMNIIKSAHNNNPNATYIYRDYNYHASGPEQFIKSNGNSIISAVDVWVNHFLPVLRYIPFAYFESFNEPEPTDLYLAFEAQRIRRLHQLGFRACVLNVAVGKTDEKMWGRAYDMVKAAIDCGALVGTHNYSQTVISADTGESGFNKDTGQWHGDVLPTSIDYKNSCWTGLRILRDAMYLKAQGQGNVDLVSTETGLDDLNGAVPYAHQGHTKGWRTCSSVWSDNQWTKDKSNEEFYLEQIKWWANIVAKYESIIGVKSIRGVVYTYGTSTDDWKPFDVVGVL